MINKTSKYIYIKPVPFSDNIIQNEKTKIKAECSGLNCEFGYKTDLYGNVICSCFNPCLVSFNSQLFFYIT